MIARKKIRVGNLQRAWTKQCFPLKSNSKQQWNVHPQSIQTESMNFSSQLPLARSENFPHLNHHGVSNNFRALNLDVNSSTTDFSGQQFKNPKRSSQKWQFDSNQLTSGGTTRSISYWKIGRGAIKDHIMLWGRNIHQMLAGHRLPPFSTVNDDWSPNYCSNFNTAEIIDMIMCQRHSQ